MPRTGRGIGLILAIAMFVFSVWIYSQTGDWVAVVFAIGSAAYTVFFVTSASRD